MTIAEQVKTTINAKCPGTFSLYAGYGMNGGEYVRFPQAAQVHEKRNENGRVIKARYRYADGSQLEYSYSATREAYKLTTQKG
jgi:hypothetical protein